MKTKKTMTALKIILIGLSDLIMKLSGTSLVFIVMGWLISIAVNSKTMIHKFKWACIITMLIFVGFILINYIIDKTIKIKKRKEEKEHEYED